MGDQKNRLPAIMKILLGRTDIADFPDLDIYQVAVKTDTGAYTSAIHAIDIEEVRLDGVPFVQFKILDDTHPDPPFAC